MKHIVVCQSCSMPMPDTDLAGTNKDGSASKEYCKYCFRNGEFTEPGMTFQEMKASVIDKMEKEKIPADIIEAAIARLSGLKRWKTRVPAKNSL